MDAVDRERRRLAESRRRPGAGYLRVLREVITASAKLRAITGHQGAFVVETGENAPRFLRQAARRIERDVSRMIQPGRVSRGTTDAGGD